MRNENKGKKSILCVKVDSYTKYLVMAYAASTGKRAAEVITELVRKGLTVPTEQKESQG